MKPIVWISASIVLAAICGVLLLGRFGLWRDRDLTTRIGTRETYQPTTADSFKPVEDWPAWRGPRGDGISRENAGESWPAGGLKRLWVADVGLGFSSPIAVVGRLFVFSLNN